MAKGLDEIHLFSDTVGVDVVLRDSERIIWSDLDAVGPKNAAQIWGFMSCSISSSKLWVWQRLIQAFQWLGKLVL